MKKRIAEFRASLKSLTEQRNDKATEMQSIVEGAKVETRALSSEEIAKFNALESEISAIDATIKAEERARSLSIVEAKDGQKDNGSEQSITLEAMETRAFANYVRGEISEQRADVNLEKAANGAVIPKTIASKIIETVKELSPIYSLTTKYTMKGELVFPVYDETEQKISCAYAEEFKALSSTSGKFTSVSLTGFLAGALSKVSLSLVNNSDFGLVNFVIQKIAQAISEFLEKELLIGTAGKMTGVLSSTKGSTAAAVAAITADELISLQMVVPQIFQKNAVWIMHKNTFESIRKLKDSEGRYLLNYDITTAFGWTLLGKPVHVSENMPKLAAGAKAIAYGDMGGLYMKLVSDVSIQVLREAYATEHALGVVAWIEADSKIIEPQKIAVLTMKAA